MCFLPCHVDGNLESNGSGSFVTLHHRVETEMAEGGRRDDFEDVQCNAIKKATL